MELPHGVPLRSFKGPIELVELNTALLNDAFTGFMRASLFEGSFAEGIIIYNAGKPLIAFSSDGKTDRPDNELKAIAPITMNEDTVIELFLLNDSQLRLIMDFNKDFIIRQPASLNPPPQPPKPAVGASRSPPAPRPKAPEKPLSLPEVRGAFVKSENSESLISYIESRNDETGHAVLIRQDGAGYAECHLLFLHGKAVAAYSASSKEVGTALLHNTLDAGGVIEFYRVDDAIIHSILKMYPQVSAAHETVPEPALEAAKAPDREPVREPPRPEPKPLQVLRPDSKPYIPFTAPVKPEPVEKPGPGPGPATWPPENLRPMEIHRFDVMPRQGPGISTRALFEKTDRQGDAGMGAPAPEPKSTGALMGDLDDDADFVMRVEKEFVGNVDDLLKRLELSHLKVVPDKKKRP